MRNKSIVVPERLICTFAAPNSSITVVQVPVQAPDDDDDDDDDGNGDDDEDTGVWNTVLQGYAAKFGSLSQDLGGYRTTLAPTAFDEVLPGADVRFLVNHDPNQLLGRTKSGTLSLSTDETGLKFTANPPNTALAQHHIAAINRGDMDGCSFSCDIDDDDWDFDGPDPVRTINSVSALYDIGPVTFPAFTNTSVEQAKFALEAARSRRSEALEAAVRRGRRIHLLLQLVSLGH